MPNFHCLMVVFILVTEVVFAAGEDHRFVMNLKFPAGQSVAVVGEGDFEPRSIGSYSVRIYSGSNPDFPFDKYVTGLIRPRDGFIEDVTFYDLDGDGMAEILVIIRSAGSGGYLSADAFRYASKSLTLLASVSGLPKDTDPISALRTDLRSGSR